MSILGSDKYSDRLTANLGTIEISMNIVLESN